MKKLLLICFVIILNFNLFAAKKIKFSYNDNDGKASLVINFPDKNTNVLQKYLESYNLLIFDVVNQDYTNVEKIYSFNTKYITKLKINKLNRNYFRISVYLNKNTKFRVSKYDRNIRIHLFYFAIKNENPLENSNLAFKFSTKDKINVVIDPGHGGKDPGTTYKNIYEKNIVFNLAKLLKRELLSKKYNGKFNVYLTRNNDKYISLYDRRKATQKYDADIFVSLHVNSSEYNKNANGSEIFFVSEKGANSRELEILVKRENISDIVAGNFNIVEDNNPLSFVLMDLTKRSVITQSIQLALNLADKLTDLEPKHNRNKIRNVKRAPFAVLKTLRCPAVLVEVGFITNKKDRKKMIDNKYFLPKYARKMGEGIYSFYKNTIQKITFPYSENLNDTNEVKTK